MIVKREKRSNLISLQPMPQKEVYWAGMNYIFELETRVVLSIDQVGMPNTVLTRSWMISARWYIRGTDWFSVGS